jgi:hypothetical protein
VRVIDEYGVEVGADVIDPDMIEDWRPPADDYVVDWEFERDLMEVRDRKLELLDRIDSMDERSQEDDLTTDDLAEMRKELEEFAPEDVKQRRLGHEYRPAVRLGDEFGAAAARPAGDQVRRNFQIPTFDQ